MRLCYCVFVKADLTWPRGSVIFDFDGTIADSFDVFVEAFEQIAGTSRQLTKTEVDELRTLSSHDIIQRLGVKKWQIPIFAIKGRRAIGSKMARVQIFDGMQAVIENLAKDGYKLYIVSSNEKTTILTFLRKYGLDQYFSGISAGTSVFGKARRLRALIKSARIDHSVAMYVGDETRDIDASKAVGLRCIAVAWGYNTQESLLRHTPDALVVAPGNLAVTVKSLSSG